VSRRDEGSREPKGDRAGKGLDLASGNLHSYWAGSLDKTIVPAGNESTTAYLARAANVVINRASEGLARRRTQDRQVRGLVQGVVRESFESRSRSPRKNSARRRFVVVTIRRLPTARQRLRSPKSVSALAGHRLGALLEEFFGE
jgi:hypothetical protein